MPTFISRIALCLLLFASVTYADKIDVLIIDGQNNHQWRKTTPVMVTALEAGNFRVDVATSPPAGEDMSSFQPKFADYDAVVSNYNGDLWSPHTQDALLEYVRDGGGFVVVHAANNSFSQWAEYNRMIGLGGWGDRKKDAGPYVYFKDGRIVRDNQTPGAGGSHGPQHEFTVIVRDANHPVTQDMPMEWMHAKDELYDSLRGPATDMRVLATAYSEKSGRHEPMIMTLRYGAGRVFHTPMGHADYSMKCVGFISTLKRGTEWAATGSVTHEIPEDFPSASSSSSRDMTASEETVKYPGGDGPGKGKHIVLISGDEEYRSEEAMPLLGKILSHHHGFTCTVLFSLGEGGIVDANNQRNITGLSALKDADLMMIATRFRRPDEGMEHIDQYISSGKPVIGLRTATHAFNGLKGKYAKYNDGHEGDVWEGGFGREILGERWVRHHGHHGKESTRGILTDLGAKHPIGQGIYAGEIWGTTDVYAVRLPLPGDSQPIVLGQVLDGMSKDDKPVEGKKNNPMMPVAWIKTYKSDSGKTGRVFTTTMGASQDFVEPGLRRLVVNGVYWCLGMEDQITANSNVDIVGDFRPSDFGFTDDDYWPKQNKRPSDFKL